MRSEKESTSSAQNQLEQQSQDYWLWKIISPVSLQELKTYPAYNDSWGPSTDEYIIANVLYGQLFLPEIQTTENTLTEQENRRLLNLFALFQVVALPSMRAIEQKRIRFFANISPINFMTLTSEINDQTRADIVWLWNTFGLEKPPQVPQELLPEGTIINSS